MTFKTDKPRKRVRGRDITISGPDSPPAANPKNEELERGRIRRRIAEIEELQRIDSRLYDEVWD